MSEEDKAKNSHGAVGSIAGIKYQDYYFMQRLLTLKAGETVSYEKIDDVGSEDSDGRTYYQLKHTIAGTAGNPKMMAERHDDLWKTITVWIDIIKKETSTENRSHEEQKEWIESSTFVLLSNKSAEDNELWEKIQAYQTKNETFDDLDTYLKKLYENTNDSKNKDGEMVESKKKKQIKTLIVYPLRKEFLTKVNIVLKSDNDIYEDILYTLEHHKHIPRRNVVPLFDMLKGGIDRLALETIQIGLPMEFNDIEFNKEFGHEFARFKVRNFVPVNRTVDIPVEPKKQMFIRQLLDAKCIKKNNIEEISNLTLYRLRFEDSYRKALETVGVQGEKEFEREVRVTWKNSFDGETIDIEDSPTEEEIISAARKTYRAVIREKLKFGMDDLSTTDSNGCFYYFSDGENPKMGWRYDWEKKYNGQKWITE